MYESSEYSTHKFKMNVLSKISLFQENIVYDWKSAMYCGNNIFIERVS